MKRYGVMLKSSSIDVLCGWSGYPHCVDDDDNFGTDDINVAYNLYNRLTSSNNGCMYEVVEK